VQPKTNPPLYQTSLPPEDHGKVMVSRYYKVKPESPALGVSLSPYYYECNLRIDWGMDGGIYKVEFQNVEKNGG